MYLNKQKKILPRIIWIKDWCSEIWKICRLYICVHIFITIYSKLYKNIKLLTFPYLGTWGFIPYHNLHYTKYVIQLKASVLRFFKVLDYPALNISNSATFYHVHLYISTALLETKIFLIFWSWVTLLHTLGAVFIFVIIWTIFACQPSSLFILEVLVL